MYLKHKETISAALSRIDISKGNSIIWDGVITRYPRLKIIYIKLQRTGQVIQIRFIQNLTLTVRFGDHL